MSRPEQRQVEAIRTSFQDGLHLLPAHMHDGLTHYFEHGRETGGFITALLMGDHERAKLNADQANTRAWDKWMTFLLEHMPVQAFGTADKVAAWKSHKGLHGIEDGEPRF